MKLSENEKLPINPQLLQSPETKKGNSKNRNIQGNFILIYFKHFVLYSLYNIICIIYFVLYPIEE